jgi:hypothetical protein
VVKSWDLPTARCDRDEGRARRRRSVSTASTRRRRRMPSAPRVRRVASDLAWRRTGGRGAVVRWPRPEPRADAGREGQVVSTGRPAGLDVGQAGSRGTDAGRRGPPRPGGIRAANQVASPSPLTVAAPRFGNRWHPTRLNHVLLVGLAVKLTASCRNNAGHQARREAGAQRTLLAAVPLRCSAGYPPAPMQPQGIFQSARVAAPGLAVLSHWFAVSFYFVGS